jgi:hypothetical protein
MRTDHLDEERAHVRWKRLDHAHPGTIRHPALFRAHVEITLPVELRMTAAFWPVYLSLPPVCSATEIGFDTASLIADGETPTPSRLIA